MTPLTPTSLDITSEHLAQLKALFPNVFTEGKIDFSALKAELGEHVETEGERYQFTWNGKAQAKRIATTPSTGTLRPAVDESVNWDSTENLYIEGDNLEVLKLLQKAYFGKVKMIYIDPPYNTGKDFVYKDDFKDNLSNYKRLTKQVDDEGNPLTTNSDSSGRYHSNWLNMMYPRLKLARNLLRDDGVIFISIDDNEVHNLRKLCDEIFGEGNFVGQICWKNVTDNNPTRVAIEHENIICFGKSINLLKSVWTTCNSDAKDILMKVGHELTSKISDQIDLQNKYTEWFRENKQFLGKLDRYKYIDSKGVYTGSQSVHNPGKDGYRYDINHPVTEKPCKEPLMGYRFPKDTMDRMLNDGVVLFGEDHNKIIELKVYAKDYQEKMSSVIYLDGRLGSYDIRQLFEETKTIFTNPKPLDLLKLLFSYIFGGTDNEILLDFFGGSSSSAHAVMQLNADDGGNRKFILVQIPEATPEGSEARKAGYATIAEIGKERIRRAGKKIQEALTPTLSQGERELDFGTEPTTQKLDIGFKVFKLDTSNIKAWNPTPDTLQEDLLHAVDNILSDRTDEDLLYEVLIKYGLPLTLPIETVQLGQHTGFSVGMGSLVACFAKGITLDTVQAIADMSTPENPVLRVVFRDSSFADDNVKTNAVQRLKQAGVREEDVVSV